MSMDQLLGRGTRKSAATMMAAATADPEINITDADYPKERSARVDQTSIELEICLNQPVLEMLEAKKNFKYIRLMECTKCRFSICVSAVDGMAMGCIKEPEEGIPFKCPSCYMKSKVVPPYKVLSYGWKSIYKKVLKPTVLLALILNYNLLMAISWELTKHQIQAEFLWTESVNQPQLHVACIIFSEAGTRPRSPTIKGTKAFLQMWGFEHCHIVTPEKWCTGQVELQAGYLAPSTILSHDFLEYH
ncbi:hypothetical protein FIBSPDRAFT_884478 [Athelia psychrophila]|uniref:Uncharacterized protein n=1 Tax=Athelia psychrophila TaxID=1759441 RepID=A0A166T690_9AGAM|nr:hypothetical protein FIBSPDRAFT_884478 [Fibularhizoctonia sp. CBS 109695]